MAKKRYIPAASGTKLYLYRISHSEDAVFDRQDDVVVVWQLHNKKEYDGGDTYRWFTVTAIGARTGKLNPDDEDYIIVYPDGTIDYNGMGGMESLSAAEAALSAEYETLRDKHRCLDCRELHLHVPTDKAPMLESEIWERIVPGGKGILCRSCMEKRLGRPIGLDDLETNWLQTPSGTHYVTVMGFRKREEGSMDAWLLYIDRKGEIETGLFHTLEKAQQAAEEWWQEYKDEEDEALKWDSTQTSSAPINITETGDQPEISINKLPIV